MALSFKGKNGWVEWHVGQDAPWTDTAYIDKVDVGGHELGLVLDKFINLPMLRVDGENPTAHPRGYVMSWYGDHARFIVGNLNLLK